MKRFTLLLLCALFVLSSSVLFALPASAAEKIVYVNDGGTGDGSSAARVTVLPLLLLSELWMQRIMHSAQQAVQLR